MTQKKGLKSPKRKTIVKSDNTIKRLPKQLLNKALSRARERFHAYSGAYQFCMKRRDKHIEHICAYGDLIKDYKFRRKDAELAFMQNGKEAREYLELMRLTWAEIT